MQKSYNFQKKCRNVTIACMPLFYSVFQATLKKQLDTSALYHKLSY